MLYFLKITKKFTKNHRLSIRYHELKIISHEIDSLIYRIVESLTPKFLMESDRVFHKKFRNFKFLFNFYSISRIIIIVHYQTIPRFETIKINSSLR